MVYTFPNRRIPEVLQILNYEYGQQIGIRRCLQWHSIVYDIEKTINIDPHDGEVIYTHKNKDNSYQMVKNKNQITELYRSNKFRGNQLITFNNGEITNNNKIMYNSIRKPNVSKL